MDPYIDYRQVSVHGRYFYRQVEALIGASELVDVEALRRLVLARVEAVEAAGAGEGSLRQARTSFLAAYHKVARRLIRGLLAELGREHELRRYFRDLQATDEREIVGDVPDELAGDHSDDVAA